jgi:hypothetical protein
MKRTLTGAVVAGIVTLLVLQCAEAHCGERVGTKVDVVRPLAIYGLGGVADWSASKYAFGANPGLHEVNHFGLTGGVVFTSALFMGADLALQKTHHKGTAKVLRVVYVIGVGGLVVNSLAKARRVGK